MINVYEKFLETMAVFSLLADIPDTKKTTEQKLSMDKAIGDLTSNFKEYFDFLSESFYDRVEAFALDSDSVRTILADPSVQPPSVTSNPSIQALLDTMNEAVTAYATVSGLLEHYQPISNRFAEDEKRLQRLVRGMTLSDKEWRASGMFEVFHKDSIIDKIRSLQELVDTLKWRKERIEYVYTVTSRMLAANLNDRTGEVTLSENLPSFVKKRV